MESKSFSEIMGMTGKEIADTSESLGVTDRAYVHFFVHTNVRMSDVEAGAIHECMNDTHPRTTMHRLLFGYVMKKSAAHSLAVILVDEMEKITAE